MIAIEVILNGERLAVVGQNKTGMVTASLNAQCFERPGELSRGYLSAFGVSGTKDIATWVERENLKAGDEVVLRIVDVAEVDAPLNSSAVPQLSFWAKLKMLFS